MLKEARACSLTAHLADQQILFRARKFCIFNQQDYIWKPALLRHDHFSWLWVHDPFTAAFSCSVNSKSQRITLTWCELDLLKADQDQLWHRDCDCLKIKGIFSSLTGLNVVIWSFTINRICFTRVSCFITTYKQNLINTGSVPHAFKLVFVEQFHWSIINW